MGAYFDNAATTYPKPNAVYDYMDKFYRENGGNAGRGQYKLAATASRVISETRKMIQKVLQCENKEVIFAPSATLAMNIIKQRVLNELNRPYPLKRMLVHMPTGTGKTKTAMHTLVHYYNFTLKKQGTVIWLAHTTELLQQAYETFTDVWEHLGDGQINAYKLWGQRNLSIPKDGFNGVMFCGIERTAVTRQLHS